MSAEPSRVQDATVIPIRQAASVPDAPAVPAPPAVPATPVRYDIDWKDLVQPPDIWSDDRPSLRKLWLYGVYGKWTNIDGIWRILGAIWSTIALAVHAVAYTALWLTERFSRFAVTVVLITLLVLVLKH
jgi:hypothetical protein